MSTDLAHFSDQDQNEMGILFTQAALCAVCLQERKVSARIEHPDWFDQWWFVKPEHFDEWTAWEAGHPIEQGRCISVVQPSTEEEQGCLNICARHLWELAAHLSGYKPREWPRGTGRE